MNQLAPPDSYRDVIGAKLTSEMAQIINPCQQWFIWLLYSFQPHSNTLINCRSIQNHSAALTPDKFSS